MKKTFSVKLTRWSARALAAGVLVLCVCFRDILSWWHSWRGLPWQSAAGLLAGFYLCAVPVLLALHGVDRLMGCILMQQTFARETLALLGRICRCCAAVAVICLGTAVCYPGLVFLAAIFAFLSLVVRVVVQVMEAAVALREENELTV